MSRPTTECETLTALLDRYVEAFNRGEGDESLLQRTLALLLNANDPEEFRLIAAGAWDKYFPVDTDVMIRVLRRWLEIQPNRKETQQALGSYLLAHGPDWDAEAKALLQTANSSPDSQK